MNDAQNTLKYSQIKLILLSDKQDIIAQKRKYLNSEIWQRFRKYSSDDEFEEDAYVEGWIKGVTRFWEEVKDEL